MYELLKKYRRRLLAIATAFLMIAFMVQYRGAGSGGTDPLYGKVLGTKIYGSQVQRSQYNLSLLNTKIFTQLQGPGGQPQMAPVIYELGAYAVQQMEKHPELFLMLVNEAHQQGVYVTDEMLKEKHQQLIMPDMDMRRIDVAAQVNNALRDLMMVEECFKRALTAIRVSEPITDYELATRMQQVRLSAVDFAAADYAKTLAQPTQEQFQQQFNKYKDTLPQTGAAASKENLFGFGYRYPDRVQLQYIAVPIEAVRAAVEKTRPADRWRVDARKHYLANPRLYSSTTRPAGTTQPVSTTRPFEEVALDAMDAVIMPEVEKMQTAIVGRVNSTLATDWNAYRDAKGQSKTSSLGVPFNTFEYLQKLTADIQKQYNVQITIGASGGLLGAADLKQLGAIDTAVTGARVPFSVYALLTPEIRKQLQARMPGIPQMLELWQPSMTLRDYESNAYVFRRTAFDPEHSPKDLTEVAARVEADVKMEMAMQRTQEAAEQFVKAARANGLASTALEQKKPLAETGLLGLNGGVAMGLHLSDAATRQFTAAAMQQLLQLRASGEKTAIAAIPMAREQRVIVARLDQVVPLWTSKELPQLVALVDQYVSSQVAAPLQQEWFSFGQVSKRVGYQPNLTTKPSDEDEPVGPGAGGPLDL